MASNVLWNISIHPTAETAKPSIPALGAHFASMTAWTQFGSVARGDDADLDEDTVDFPLLDEWTMVKAPVSLAAQEHILKSVGATEFSFTAYDLSQAALQIASNVATATNTLTMTATTTKRTVLIEVNGLASLYFPKCVVTVGSIPFGISGDSAAARTTFTVKPEATSAIPGGVAIDFFQSA